ncbi:MAG TPA: PEGA domain-containing protein, partial [Polyangia bacterium]|nr:PEGA domain-containing protein [Polyangia bacterium]
LGYLLAPMWMNQLPSAVPRNRRGIALFVVTAAVMTLASPLASRADTTADKKRATALLLEGAKLLDKKEFSAALERFTDAYRLVASAKIQFNIGLTQEGLDRPAEAIRAYRIYIDEATSDSPVRRADARVRIDALRPHVTQVQITSDVPGALVLIDGVEEGRTPLSRPAVVNPGPHQVVVQSPSGVGPPWTRAVRGEAGAKLELQATLQAPITPPVLAPPPPLTRTPEPVVTESTPLLTNNTSGEPPTEPSRPVYKRAWFWGVVAGVVVAGAVGAVLATRSGSTTYPCNFQSTCLGGN